MDKNEIRAWAKESGIEVNSRGRLGKNVVVSYLRANPALARSAAREQGIEVGSRGRIGSEVFEAVAESL